MSKYQVGHETDSCTCSLLEVDQDALTKILKKGDSFPLLRLTGDLNNLDLELVDSAENTPSSYIAISHVWADGLGNPRDNALYRCKLLKLREHVMSVNSVNPLSTESSGETPLIWLDTLCCPAQDGWGKQNAIEKIRCVYRQAKHVLVLDSGLMAYKSESQDVSEKLARIFTSSWMRRLWTLQEGALARSLYFQFADSAVCLENLGNLILKERQVSMRHRAVSMDFVNEFLALASFFGGHSPPTLKVLDDSLKHRGVSVLTDEPLCIGTLMLLDLAAILAVEPKDRRMQKVWEMLAIKHGGLPSQIIFFEEPRINEDGWRWAPQSLLEMGKGIHDMSSRMVRWFDPKLSPITPKGLRVQYRGYKIMKVEDYHDGKPPNPWPGIKRVEETYSE